MSKEIRCLVGEAGQDFFFPGTVKHKLPLER